jgi:hypothetical protein
MLLPLLLLLLPLLPRSLPGVFVSLQLQELLGVAAMPLRLGRWPAAAAGVTGVSKGDTDTGRLSVLDARVLLSMALLLVVIVDSDLLTLAPFDVNEEERSSTYTRVKAVFGAHSRYSIACACRGCQ